MRLSRPLAETFLLQTPYDESYNRSFNLDNEICDSHFREFCTPRSSHLLVAPSQPPVPPHLSGFGVQSTSCCGAKIGASPELEAMAAADSKASVAANAQQDQHIP